MSGVRFEFATATRIVFGPGSLAELGPIAASLGSRALLVTGRSPERAEAAREHLLAEGVASIAFSVIGEPTVGDARRGADLARSEGVDLVVACGGGSAIDAGKAVAALLGNGGDPLHYLEVVGRGQPIALPSVPFIAIPTTAGTGSEVTRNAVLASPEHRFKASLRSPLMLPRLAIVDPELTYDLPPAVTASTGLDALTQLIEPYVSCRANPMTDAVCLEGIRHAAKSLRRACRNGKDGEARAGMALAGLMGGLALANAGLGVVHGFAAPVGGMFPAPHGAVCAALLPHGMLVNIRALKRDSSRGEAYERYETVARILTGRADAAAEDGAAWVGELCRDLDIPSLRSYGVCESDVGVLVEKASKASSMKGNPIVLSPDELSEVITLAL